MSLAEEISRQNLERCELSIRGLERDAAKAERDRILLIVDSLAPKELAEKIRAFALAYP